jgi:hypothetical protein
MIKLSLFQEDSLVEVVLDMVEILPVYNDRDENWRGPLMLSLGSRVHN